MKVLTATIIIITCAAITYTNLHFIVNKNVTNEVTFKNDNRDADPVCVFVLVNVTQMLRMFVRVNVTHILCVVVRVNCPRPRTGLHMRRHCRGPPVIRELFSRDIFRG